MASNKADDALLERAAEPPAQPERLVARLPRDKYRVVETRDGSGWFVYSTDTDPSFT